MEYNFSNKVSRNKGGVRMDATETSSISFLFLDSIIHYDGGFIEDVSNRINTGKTEGGFWNFI